MDLPVIFTTAFIIGFSGAMVPGPLLTVTIGESYKLGFIAGPLLMLGHGLLEIALIFALVSGLSAFLTQTLVSHIIAIAGGIFLIYMGYGMTRDVYTGKLSFNLQHNEITGAGSGSTIINELSAAAAGKRIMRVVAMGILVSLSNPYWTIWWATVGLTYITMSLNSGYTGLTVFFTGHILADCTWYSLVAAVVTGGRKFFSGGVYKGVLLVCGVFLIGLGGYFLYNGLLV